MFSSHIIIIYVKITLKNYIPRTWISYSLHTVMQIAFKNILNKNSKMMNLTGNLFPSYIENHDIYMLLNPGPAEPRYVLSL